MTPFSRRLLRWFENLNEAAPTLDPVQDLPILNLVQKTSLLDRAGLDLGIGPPHKFFLSSLTLFT